MNITCSEPGCDRPVVARGLCSRDWQRWRKLQGPRIPPAREIKLCEVEDCPRKAKSKGFCNRHYENLRLRGDPVPQRDRPLMERIREIGWTVTASGCHEWQGARNGDGYAILNHQRVSRLIYEDEHGISPVVVRHSCDNPPCIRRDHLIGGTQAQNVRDMVERRRHWRHGRASCDNGHDLTVPGARRRARQGETEFWMCVECERARKQRWEAKNRRKRKLIGA